MLKYVKFLTIFKIDIFLSVSMFTMFKKNCERKKKVIYTKLIQKILILKIN